MDRDQSFVFNKLRAAWDQATGSMKQIYQFCAQQPPDFHAIFRAVDGQADEVKFEIGPVVFLIPERLGRSHQLYVAVEGRLSFEKDKLRDGPLKTRAFGTRVAYFKQKGGNLEHVFGAHYDLDELSPGHPVFHAQLQGMSEMADKVRELFRLTGETINSFQPQVRNIRIPCAQMDVFSAILQMCADHLVIKGVDGQVADEFSKMRAKSDFFIGAAHRLPYISSPVASNCYRSWHWYGGDRPVAEAAGT